MSNPTLYDYYGEDYERKARRRSQRNRDLADLRDGRRDRSVKFSDVRKANSAKACRGHFDWQSELDEWED